MCSRTVLSLTLFPHGGALSCHNTVAPNSSCHSSHCKEDISEFTGSVVICADVTQNKMCLADICRAAQIKPTHKQNQDKNKISLCNWAHSKQQAWLSRTDQNGKPPSGVSYPVNLTLPSLPLSWELLPTGAGRCFLAYLYNLRFCTSYRKLCQFMFYHLFIYLCLWARIDTTKGTWKHQLEKINPFYFSLMHLHFYTGLLLHCLCNTIALNDVVTKQTVMKRKEDFFSLLFSFWIISLTFLEV